MALMFRIGRTYNPNCKKLKLVSDGGVNRTGAPAGKIFRGVFRRAGDNRVQSHARRYGQQSAPIPQKNDRAPVARFAGRADTLMSPLSLAPVLTPHGHLVLCQSNDAPALEPGLDQRLLDSFARGSGHGLLQLGAEEVGTALPPVFSYWRELGTRYVTLLCTFSNTGTNARKAPVPAPTQTELDCLALAAPPMIGAEYLTPRVLHALWNEMDEAFAIELSESHCSIQDFLKHRNPSWNLVGRVHFNLAENRKDEISSNLYSGR